MPVFDQYPAARLPLVGDEVTILAQNGQTVNASVNALASGVLPPAPAPLLGSGGGSFTTIEPDNITIKIVNGVLSANAPPNSPLLGGTGTNYATVFPDGTTLQINTNELSAITNTANALLGLDSLGQAPLSTMKSLVLQAGTQSQSTVLVGPAFGGSGPATWRQLAASDVSGVASVPASTPLVGSSGTALQGVGIDPATLQITSNTLTPKTNTPNGLAGLDAQGTISGQTVAPSFSGITITGRSLASMREDVIYALDLNNGVPPNGVTDWAPLLNAAALDLYNRGGGTLYIPNVNGLAYMLSVPLAFYPKVKVIGEGWPILRLMSGANCAVVEIPHYAQIISYTTVTGTTITAGGTGYTSAPTVSFSGGAGSGAAATATISGGAVTGITVTNAGSGYTSAPTISFSGGAGSGAAATATIGTLSGIPTDLQGGAYDSVLQFLSLDGNSSTQTSVTPDLQNGINWTGLNVTLDHISIQNVIGHGHRSCQPPTTTGLARICTNFESKINFIDVNGAGRNGWWNNGPHDMGAYFHLYVNCGQALDRTYAGILLDTAAIGRFVHMHCWNTCTGTPITAFALVDNGGGSQISDCHFEQSYQLLQLNAKNTTISASAMVNTSDLHGNPVADSSGIIEFASSGCMLIGCFVDGKSFGAGGNSTQFAFTFGTSANNASSNTVMGCFLQNFDKVGPFNFQYDNGNNLVICNGGTPGISTGVTTFPYAPNEAAGTYVNYSQSGTTGISYVSPSPTGYVLNNAFSTSPLGAAVPGQYSATLGKVSGVGEAAHAVGSLTQGENCTVEPNSQGAWATGNQAYSGGNTSVERLFVRVRSPGQLNVRGDNQFGDQPLQCVTTTSGTHRLTADGKAASVKNSLSMQPNSATRVRCRVLAHSPSAAQPNGAQFDLTADVLFMMGATPATLVMWSGGAAQSSISLTATNNNGLTGAAVALTPDTTNGQPALTVTGIASTTIDWAGTYEFVEVL